MILIKHRKEIAKIINFYIWTRLSLHWQAWILYIPIFFIITLLSYWDFLLLVSIKPLENRIFKNESEDIDNMYSYLLHTSLFIILKPFLSSRKWIMYCSFLAKVCHSKFLFNPTGALMCSAVTRATVLKTLASNWWNNA